MAVLDDMEFAFEVTENGEPALVRSIESVSRVYLRFTNRTTRPVDVYWRDFNGQRRHYLCLQPGTSNDINTFLTHPWEFTDRETKEPYVITNKPIFRAPVNLGEMQYRTNWNITIGVRTLRHTALLCVALLVGNPEHVPALELPRLLEEELVTLVAELTNIASVAD